MQRSNWPQRVPGSIYAQLVVALFVLGICSPLLDWRFELDPGQNLVENRTAAVAPAWPKTRTQWQALPAALQAYWNDAFGFRRRLLHWHSMAKYRLGISPTPAVVIGAHGWLFLASEESFEQHRGLRPFAAADLANWAKELETRRQWLASRGAHFLFVVAPDKQTIYPEQVPRRYGPFRRTPADELVAYLREHTEVDVLDLRKTISAARAGGAVFAKSDTHWNDRGAVAGYIALVERLRGWYPPMTARPLSGFSHSPAPLWSGDLALMMPGLFNEIRESDEQWQAHPAPASTELAADGYVPPASLHYSVFETPGHPDLPRAVVFHDSFLLTADERMSQNVPPGALPPPPATFRIRALLAEQFSRSAFSWQFAFDPALVERERPDVVIEEYIERQLRRGPSGTSAPN